MITHNESTKLSPNYFPSCYDNYYDAIEKNIGLKHSVHYSTEKYFWIQSKKRRVTLSILVRWYQQVQTTFPFNY